MQTVISNYGSLMDKVNELTGTNSFSVMRQSLLPNYRLPFTAQNNIMTSQPRQAGATQHNKCLITSRLSPNYHIPLFTRNIPQSSNNHSFHARSQISHAGCPVRTTEGRQVVGQVVRRSLSRSLPPRASSRMSPVAAAPG